MLIANCKQLALLLGSLSRQILSGFIYLYVLVQLAVKQLCLPALMLKFPPAESDYLIDTRLDQLLGHF